jgi:hypothetical protein
MGENNVTELDFDELDRAVNSLISTTTSSPVDVETTEKTLTLEETTDVPTVDPSPAPVSDTTATPVDIPSLSSPQTLATKRSSGRFMDVVHPSSDMRPNLTHASTLHQSPIASTITTVDTGHTVEPVVPLPVAPVSNDWPDPLDYTAPKDMTEPDTVALDTPVQAPVEETAEDDDDIDAIANDINNTLKPETEEAQTSPFLPDTKVEKRPLGAFSTETPAIAAEVTPVEPSVVLPPIVEAAPTEPVDESQTPANNGDAQIPPANEADAPLPEELQSDLLSIESDPSSSVVEAPLSPTVEVKPAEIDTPVGPTAITQQYKEEPSTGDQQSGAIFDTKSYHKAFSQPVKQKRKKTWMLWVLLLIIVGGGIGFCIYYFVLPALT